MSKIVNELRFKTPGELLSYRDIHVENIRLYEADMNRTPELEAAIQRHKEYIVIIDMMLHDAFLNTTKDRMLTGMNIDPLLFPGIDVPRFIQATKVLSLNAPETTQKVIEFKESETYDEPQDPPVLPKPLKDKEDKGMDLEKLIKEIFKLNGQELLTIVNAAKVYAGKTKSVDIEREGIGIALDKIVKDNRFEWINKIGKLNFVGRWMLKLLKQHENPVPAMLNLKLKFFDTNPMEVGQLFAWITEYAFNKNQKEGKVDDWTWKQYVQAMDSPFRLVVDKEDITPKREKIEKDLLQGTILVRDLTTCRGIFDNEDVKKFYLSYASSIKDVEKKKLFFNGEDIRPDVYHRTIEECITYGSSLRRDAIMERRIKKLTGEATSKKYDEGKSGYDNI